MEKRYWTLREAMELLDLDEGFITRMSREEIIEVGRGGDEGEGLLSSGEMEKLRVARTLLKELDVNVPGVEVILQMRLTMIRMRKQFDEILTCLVEEFERILKDRERS